MKTSAAIRQPLTQRADVKAWSPSSAPAFDRSVYSASCERMSVGKPAGIRVAAVLAGLIYRGSSMKECRSLAMRTWLNKGLRKARKMRMPSDGMMSNLFYKTLSNGWHYQVELIHDTRVREKPYVAVYAFKPPARFFAKRADLYLTSDGL